jgi:hypothetical protein
MLFRPVSACGVFGGCDFSECVIDEIPVLAIACTVLRLPIQVVLRFIGLVHVLSVGISCLW